MNAFSAETLISDQKRDSRVSVCKFQLLQDDSGVKMLLVTVLVIAFFLSPP